jgi:hypothetical protein
MRHASIQTTMNVYGQAMLESKRTANRKVVEMALRGAPSSTGDRARHGGQLRSGYTYATTSQDSFSC